MTTNETPTGVDLPTTKGRKVQIADLISELTGIQDRWGNTCVYIRDMSWGAVALNRRADDEKAVPSGEVERLRGEVARLIATRQEWRSRMGLRVTDDVVVENERLRAENAELRRQVEGLEQSRDDMLDAAELYMDKLTAAQAELATLRQQLDSDCEAITEDWLRSVGFETAPNPAYVAINGTDLGIGFRTTTKEWELSNLVDWEEMLTLPTAVAPKTRGDVRRLAAALGIALKE
jgi:hypothetical protein